MHKKILNRLATGYVRMKVKYSQYFNCNRFYFGNTYQNNLVNLSIV